MYVKYRRKYVDEKVYKKIGTPKEDTMIEIIKILMSGLAKNHNNRRVRVIRFMNMKKVRSVIS